MLLSAEDIAAKVADGSLTITPFEERNLKPVSYVLTLGSRFLRWRGEAVVDVFSPEAGRGALVEEPAGAGEVVLDRGDFVLAGSRERLALPDDHAGMLAGLSHLARFGLSVNIGSSLVAPGFGAGTPTALTLELHSLNPGRLRLKVGMPICHLALTPASRGVDPRRALARSVYEGEPAPGPPRLWEEFGVPANPSAP